MSANGNNNSGRGLDTSDIIGIAVGVVSGLLALIGVVIAFCAWKYPATPAGQLGDAIRHRVSKQSRGGDAFGGNAHGPYAQGGSARGGDGFAYYALDTGDEEAHAIGGSAFGGDALFGR